MTNSAEDGLPPPDAIDSATGKERRTEKTARADGEARALAAIHQPVSGHVALTLDNAPLGTKAPAIGGGYWIRSEHGWSWCTGATFPRPGGDWNGKLLAPAAAPASAGPAPAADNVRGFSLWFSREDWGIVMDGVILEVERSEKRKQENSESVSDVRADAGRAILAAIDAASPLACDTGDLLAELDWCIDEGSAGPRSRAAMQRARAMLAAHIGQPAGAQAAARDLWKCFHCDEEFTDRGKAALHFGYSERQAPACKLDEAYLRDLEAEVTRYREEDTALHREIAGHEARQRAATQRAEEEGYARGLRDAATLPATAGPAATPAATVVRVRPTGKRPWGIRWVEGFTPTDGTQLYVVSAARAALSAGQITAGAAVLGDNGQPIGRNTALMVADAMFPAHRPGTGSAVPVDTIMRHPHCIQQHTGRAGEERPLTRCAASRDGECRHSQCPQLRDGEPAKSRRHCPIDTGPDEE